jgi:hypothetical protein
MMIVSIINYNSILCCGYYPRTSGGLLGLRIYSTRYSHTYLPTSYGPLPLYVVMYEESHEEFYT